MNFDEMTAIVGAQSVQDMVDLVTEIYATKSTQQGRAALVELLVAMIASVLIRDATQVDEQRFSDEIDTVCDRLRAICIASRSIELQGCRRFPVS